MRRPIDNPGSGSDRPTTPGVGEDPRATLPEPQPGIAKADFARTIPVGSSFAAEWLAQQQPPGTQDSGVHQLEAKPATKSDRVPARTSKQTLHGFAAAPPPVIETDDKRWIGTNVDREVGPTQRVFTAATQAHAPSITPPPTSLGSTVRAMSTPPPADATTPHAVIQPVRTIQISPEIAIPTRRNDGAAAPTKPIDDAASMRAATTLHGAPGAPDIASVVIPTLGESVRSPEIRPLPPPLEPRSVGQRARPRKPSLQQVRLAAFGLGALCVVTGAALYFSFGGSPAPATTPAAATATTPAPVDLKPTTEIVTVPAGAEIILRGALVANTPARLTRPSYEALYLVRMAGYQPQLVALSPHSPEVIRIELHSLSTSQVSAVAGPVPLDPAAAAAQAGEALPSGAVTDPALAAPAVTAPAATAPIATPMQVTPTQATPTQAAPTQATASVTTSAPVPAASPSSTPASPIPPSADARSTAAPRAVTPRVVAPAPAPRPASATPAGTAPAAAAGSGLSTTGSTSAMSALPSTRSNVISAVPTTSTTASSARNAAVPASISPTP